MLQEQAGRCLFTLELVLGGLVPWPIHYSLAPRSVSGWREISGWL